MEGRKEGWMDDIPNHMNQVVFQDDPFTMCGVDASVKQVNQCTSVRDPSAASSAKGDHFSSILSQRLHTRRGSVPETNSEREATFPHACSRSIGNQSIEHLAGLFGEKIDFHHVRTEPRRTHPHLPSPNLTFCFCETSTDHQACPNW